MSEASRAQPDRLDRDLSASHGRCLGGPYIFEITALTVTFRDDPIDHSIGIAWGVFLAIEA